LEVKSERIIDEEKAITSLSLSKDGKYLLVNLVNQEIHLWDIAGKLKSPLKYKGHRQQRYVIRSCFGGSDQAFIASGSEDSQVSLPFIQIYFSKPLSYNSMCLYQTSQSVCMLETHQVSKQW
jgi:WD40 repeat protein